MRVPNEVHESHPWRIREIAPDFTVEDVWALPVHGGVDDFDDLVQVMSTLDFPSTSSLPARVLWATRDLVGRVFGLGRISTDAAASTGQLPIPGTDETSLRQRLPADLRDTAPVDPTAPFTALYRTADEYAAEMSNRTVHGVLHLAWADRGDGRYQGQMAVYVKPRGVLGDLYMALIKPFRYLIVYPALMAHIERAWSAVGDRASHGAR